jgi:hypothetical protein
MPDVASPAAFAAHSDLSEAELERRLQGRLADLEALKLLERKNPVERDHIRALALRAPRRYTPSWRRSQSLSGRTAHRRATR